MKLASLCFRTAVVIALIGFGLGIRMGVARDFSLLSVHAHSNWLGWVSFCFCLYAGLLIFAWIVFRARFEASESQS